MTKEQLLQELNSNTYVRIKPSVVHGIGVFAIRKIPKACRSMFSDDPGEWHQLSKKEVNSLTTCSKELIETYCLFDEDVYYVPANGFKSMDISLFLNHSDQPNIISVEDGTYFEALRDIEPGEELLIDYGTIVDSAE